jgi:hypothetical protein
MCRLITFKCFVPKRFKLYFVDKISICHRNYYCKKQNVNILILALTETNNSVK